MRSLSYPIACIEDGRDNPLFGFDVYFGRLDYVVVGNVHIADLFGTGVVLDSGGREYRYSGSAGWPRFPLKYARIIGPFIVPGLIAKLLQYFVYFGPQIKDSTQLSLDEFRNVLIEKEESHEGKEDEQLRFGLRNSKSYVEVIKAFQNWRYHGGVRDPDGHDENSPEYSP